MAKHAWQLKGKCAMRLCRWTGARRPPTGNRIWNFPHGDGLLRWNWNVQVPGSLAPDVFYQSMVQDWANQGYDVSEAEALIPEGRALEAANKMPELRVLSARIMKALKEAPKIEGHPYLPIRTPGQLGGGQGCHAGQPGLPARFRLARSIYAAHPARLDWSAGGGSFGTAIEGYIGSQIERVYGKVRGYITSPETINDDVGL